MANHVLDFEIVSDKPLPENIEEIASEVSNITMVAIIARDSVQTPEDVNAILTAVFMYTDERGYDRELVGQLINQLIANLTKNASKEEMTDGN
jgi:hypothetical protein